MLVPSEAWNIDRNGIPPPSSRSKIFEYHDTNQTIASYAENLAEAFVTRNSLPHAHTYHFYSNWGAQQIGRCYFLGGFSGDLK